MIQIIPLGDHCTSALILKRLGLRHKSYPFDWISHVDELNGSTLPIILDAMKSLLSGVSITTLLADLLPIYDANLRSEFSVRNYIKFPHDQFHVDYSHYKIDYTKYERRFIRLVKLLFLSSSPSIYFIISKRLNISSPTLISLADELYSLNRSKILILSGSNYCDFSTYSHRSIDYFHVPYRLGVPAWNEYTGHDFVSHDLTYWRAELLRISSEYFASLKILPANI